MLDNRRIYMMSLKPRKCKRLNLGVANQLNRCSHVSIGEKFMLLGDRATTKWASNVINIGGHWTRVLAKLSIDWLFTIGSCALVISYGLIHTPIIWFSVIHTIIYSMHLFHKNSSNYWMWNQRGCHMTLGATWQITETALINMAHQFFNNTSKKGV